MSSDTFNRVVYELKKMPGIGSKTAQRMTLYLMRISEQEAGVLCQAINNLKTKVISCSDCGNFTEQDPCSICSDSQRNHQLICVVEEPKDMMAIEKSQSFRGVYHILMGRLSPFDNIRPQDLRIKALKQRINKEQIKEIVLATSPSMEGETTAIYLANQCKAPGITISRIARGIPMGGEIEFADELTISKALEGRQPI